MNWKEKAIKILKDSLYPIPSELNELDWKSGLSDKTAESLFTEFTMMVHVLI